MTIDHDEVKPSVVVDIEECVSPADQMSRCAGDSRDVRDVGKVEIAVIAEELCILLAEVRDDDR